MTVNTIRPVLFEASSSTTLNVCLKESQHMFCEKLGNIGKHVYIVYYIFLKCMLHLIF